MKYLKVLAVAVIAMFAFEGAKAQVVVKARMGAPVQRTYHRRTVVVNRPVYHRNYHRRAVIVNRPVYRRTVVRPVYHRNYRRHAVVRHY
jgi:hypothetical protein